MATRFGGGAKEWTKSCLILHSSSTFSVANISRSDEEIRCRVSVTKFADIGEKVPTRIKPFHSSERFRTSGERAQVLAANCVGFHFFLGILLDVDFSLRKSHHGGITYTLASSWQVSTPSVVGIRPTASPCSSARQTGMQRTYGKAA